MQGGIMDNKGSLLFFPCVMYLLIVTIINYEDFLWGGGQYLGQQKWKCSI